MLSPLPVGFLQGSVSCCPSPEGRNRREFRRWQPPRLRGTARHLGPATRSRAERSRCHRATVSALTMTRRLAHAGHELRSVTPESPIDVVERWPRPLFLERRHLLSQSEVLHHDIGSAPTHCSKRANAERDQDDKNTEHGGGVCSSFPAISSLQRIPKPGGLRPVSP